jgi:hypothetical protein
MGHSVLSTLHSRLGNPDLAYDFFVKSFKPNEVPPFGVLSETAGGTNPYFATGAGGMLQAVIFGFGGIQITDTGIIQNKPKLPSRWKWGIEGSFLLSPTVFPDPFNAIPPPCFVVQNADPQRITLFNGEELQPFAGSGF